MAIDVDGLFGAHIDCFVGVFIGVLVGVFTGTILRLSSFIISLRDKGGGVDGGLDAL